MDRILVLLIICGIFISCKDDSPAAKDDVSFISAVDISSYPEISNSDLTFYNLDGVQEDFLSIIKSNGINTIRLRLWVHPSNEHSGFNEVKQFSDLLKSKGFKTWLTLHYSDTWADPGHQETPLQWQGITFDDLKYSVYNYTEQVMAELNPNYIQIGNEINTGLLHPQGHMQNSYSDFIELMDIAIEAVRHNSEQTKILIHFAGIEGSDSFFNKVQDLDYDIIGLSYYPIWHGKSLDKLKLKMKELSETYNREIVIAETAYPFTLEWNDWTTNIVGESEQLILPDYPATTLGQAEFVQQMYSMSYELEMGVGFCYWGAELVAWKGSQSTNGSPWENQALFDFNNKALPVLREFNSD